MLELKEGKGPNIHQLYNAFLFLAQNIKLFGYKTGIQFNNTALVVKQNNYTSKIVNTCIVHDLNYFSRNWFINFILKISWLVRLI